MSIYFLAIKPNWRPALSPAWRVITTRLQIGGGLSISEGFQRREDPTLLTYDDFTLQLANGDRVLDDFFDLANVVGTTTTDQRAPIVHMGEVLLCRKRQGQTSWEVFYGFIDSTQIRPDPDMGVTVVTVFSPAKLLEKGNAERVHRFSSIVEPQPYVILGYDLLHPAVPPGGTGPDDAWWTITGGAALPLAAGDLFNAVAHVAPGDYLEAMQLSELSSASQKVIRTTVSGSDLLVNATNAEDGTVEAGLVLTAGQSSMEILTPWYRGKQSPELMTLLIAEVNNAMAAAGVSLTLTITQDPVSGTLGAAAIDLIDNNGLDTPMTGAGYFASAASTTRSLAVGSGSNGIEKDDILLDPVSVERTFPNWKISTAVKISKFVNGASADYGHPLTYPNPTRQLPGSPPPDLSKAPAVGQSRVHIQNQGIDQGTVFVTSTLWHATSPSLVSAVGATKYAYRIEHSESAYTKIVVGSFTLIHPRKLVIGLYSTTDEGQTWTLSSSSSLTHSATQQGAQVLPFEDDFGDGLVWFEPGAQPWLSMYDLGGGDFLYLVLSPVDRKAYWRKNSGAGADHIAPSNLIPGAGGLASFGDQPGYRSGGVTDGTNFFFFDDSTEVRSFAGSGTLSGTNGSANITGSGTSFTTQIQPGDTITDVLTGVIGTYVVQSVTDNTHLVLTEPIQEASFSGVQYVVGHTGTLGFFYWNGSTMAAGTLVGFPAMNGADFQGAVFDPGRGKMYITISGSLYAITCSFSAGTLTATAFAFGEIDQPSNDPGRDMIPFASLSSATVIDRTARPAWITGPVDIAMGSGGNTVNYPAAGEAMLVVTENSAYVYSDVFGGIVQLADFSGMSCAKAIAELGRISAQVVASGADLDTTVNPALYTPSPVIRVSNRQDPSLAARDLTAYIVKTNPEPWILQYSYVGIQNSKYGIAEVRNDLSFVFDGVTYIPKTLRYLGSAALQIDSRFVFTRSFMRLMANSYAVELLIPRLAGILLLNDPRLASTLAPVRPRQRITFVTRSPDHFGVGKLATGRILRVVKHLDDDLIQIEAA